MTISAVRSAKPVEAIRLAAYGATAEAHLIVPPGSTAAPATAWFVDLAGAATPRYPLSEIVADLTFATGVAEGAASAVLRGVPQ